MPIGSAQYTTFDLSMVQRETLYRAAHAVAERYMDDLEQLARKTLTFEQTSMADEDDFEDDEDGEDGEGSTPPRAATA
jgi:hypothetical protein